MVMIDDSTAVSLDSIIIEAHDTGYERATADIVAWLREHTASNMARVFADAIERGDFRKVTA